MSTVRQKAIDGLNVGDTFVIKRTLTKEDIIHFEAISRDYNPVHSNANFANAKGFDGPIAHGLLTASLITQVGGQLAWLASSMSFRFKRPVYACDELTCTWTIVRIDEGNRAHAEVSVQNSGGVLVLTAETSGVIPNEHERALLASIEANLLAENSHQASQ